MAKKINYASLYTLRADGRYQGSYTDEKGRHYVYDRDPEKLYHKLQEKIAAKDAPHILTFQEVEEMWEREHREEIEPRTWANYEPHCEDIVGQHGKKAFSDITALDVANDLSIAKAKGYSATIVKTRRSIWKMIFDYAVVNGIAQYNPVTSIHLPKGLKRGKRIAPTKEQMKIIFSHIDIPFGLFPFLLLCTGMRKSEALSLQWSDINFKSKEISVSKSIDYTNGANPKYKQPKTEAGVRTIPILDILLPHLKRAYQNKSGEYLFPCPSSNRGGKGGGLMTDRAYEGAWLRYCQAAGLMNGNKPALTAHNLRHGTATLMFELGVDELTTQKILGHSRIEITREIYTDLRNDQKIKSIKKFNNGMSKLLGANKKSTVKKHLKI